MSRVALLSANLGGFEKRLWFKQKNIPTADIFMYTDETFPPRYNAMTSRLQARIPKCFGWQMKPGYDIYIWMDAQFGLRIGGIEYMLGHLGDKDMAVFRHPHHKTIQKEWDVIHRDEPYIVERYGGELDGGWDRTLPVYAGGIFIYRNIPKVQEMLKEWWYHNSRFTLDDQLALSTVIKQFDVQINVIQDHIYNTSYFVPLRK